MARKAFNFFASYFDVAKELNDKDRLAFYDALILEQFTGKKTELKGMAKFAYVSQHHSIDAQINGFNQRIKRGDTTLEPLSSVPPAIGAAIPPAIGAAIPPAIQEKEEEEEKGKDISSTTLIDCEKLFLEKTAFNWTQQYAKKEAEKFYNFYSAKGWLIGKNKMKSLTHAIGGWITRQDKPEIINAPIDRNKTEKIIFY
jgi:hypothetical protein